MTKTNPITELERRLAERYTAAKDDYDGWYYCDFCNRKIYYTPIKPHELVKHEDECAAGEGIPEVKEETRES